MTGLCRSEPSSVNGRSGGLIVAALPPAADHSIADVVGQLMIVVGRRYSGGGRRRGGGAMGCLRMRRAEAAFTLT